METKELRVIVDGEGTDVIHVVLEKEGESGRVNSYRIVQFCAGILS